MVGIDDLSCGYAENVPAGATFYEFSLGRGDHFSEANLNYIFKKYGGFDYIYHFAAYAAEGLSPFIRTYNYRNNLVATAELVNMAIKHPPKRFVFTSSMAVYGDGIAPFDESYACYPIDPYGVAKLAAEQDIRIAGEQHGLEWTIIRPHNVYGPGQSIWQKYRNVLGIWMQRLLTDQPLLVYGNGEQRRAFSFIDDCLGPLFVAATSDKTRSQIINLGGTEATRIVDAARVLVEIAGRGSIKYREARHEVNQAWTTWQKSVELLGYEDKTSLRDGVAKMWEWAQAAWKKYPLRRDTHRVARLEVERGLYSYWREYT